MSLFLNSTEIFLKKKALHGEQGGNYNRNFQTSLCSLNTNLILSPQVGDAQAFKKRGGKKSSPFVIVCTGKSSWRGASPSPETGPTSPSQSPGEGSDCCVQLTEDKSSL